MARAQQFHKGGCGQFEYSRVPIVCIALHLLLVSGGRVGALGRGILRWPSWAGAIHGLLHALP